jgi:hypothetical protein
VSSIASVHSALATIELRKPFMCCEIVAQAEAPRNGVAHRRELTHVASSE